MMLHEPFLSDWNYRVIQLLFRLVPHDTVTDTIFGFVVFNPLLSTWIFAACFYIFWAIEDSRTVWRRTRLFQTVFAFAVALTITLVIRPWIAWPAPSLIPRFQVLYPDYLWGGGSGNSFPSHSTLTYFMIAAGLWPLHRRVSLLLSLLVIGVISVPRVYVGGHYPIDILASLVLVVLVLSLVSRWPVPLFIANWLARSGPGTYPRELLLILWVFEVGEGFRGSASILKHLRSHL